MLRVVQWATGNIGTRALRGVIEHPAMDLAGVWVHSADKVGTDAGTICGLAPIGVLATDDLDTIVDLGADCVLYMPQALSADEVCRLLASGSNVVTTRGEFHHPPSMDPALRQRVEDACAEGGTSIHSTGSSPGFITEALPLVLTSIQRRLDGVTIEEFADLSQRPSPELLFDIMGFGKSRQSASPEMAQARNDHLQGSFGPSLQLLSEAIGLPLDQIDASSEMAMATHPVEIAAGTIDADTVAAQRVTVSGMRNGQILLRFRATWYCTRDFDQDWQLLPTGWRVTVDGDAPLKVDLPFPITLDQMADTAPSYTANRAVNAVPVVCAAEPGIRTTVDLPQVIARLG